MQSNHEEYYRARVRQERTTAQQAIDAEVAAIHEQLAREYEAVLESGVLPPDLRTEARAAEVHS